MNAFRQNKTPWIMVGLLVLLNLALLAFFWTQAPPPRGPHPGPRAREEGKEILMERLEMDPAQRSQYESEFQRHRAQIDSLHALMRVQRDLLFDFEGAQRVAEEVAHEIGQLQAQIELATYTHFMRVRTFLNAEQKGRFQEVFHEILGPKGPPRGPRNGPPH